MNETRELIILRHLRRYGALFIIVPALLVALTSAVFIRSVVLSGLSRLVQSGVGGFVEQAYSPADIASNSPASARELEDLVRTRIRQAALSHVLLVRADGTVLYASDPAARANAPSPTEIARALGGRVSTHIVSENGSSLLRVTGPATFQNGGAPRAVWVGWRPYGPIAASVNTTMLILVAIIFVGASVALILLQLLLRNSEREIQRQRAEAETAQRRLEGALVDLEDASLGTLLSLTMAVDARDRYTARHSVHVADYACDIACAMGRPDLVSLLERAGLLHDLGKIGTPEQVLQKPAELSAAEFAEIQKHPETGARIISSIPFLADIVPAVRSHHERWDGRGYPDGLAGVNAPLEARILAVADAYDAMMTDRPYRKAMDERSARAELLRGGGTQFDAQIVDAFIAHLDRGRLERVAV